jgi:hypothetical protein
MLVLRAIHLIALIAWFGSALVDTIVEATIKLSPSAEKRRVLMELHRTVDLLLEGPGAIVAALSGIGLLGASGFLEPGVAWPSWLRWKVGCAGAAILINLISVGCVVSRVRALHAGRHESVARWTHAVFATGLGVPFAAVAFWVGLAHSG